MGRGRFIYINTQLSTFYIKVKILMFNLKLQNINRVCTKRRKKQACFCLTKYGILFIVNLPYLKVFG